MSQQTETALSQNVNQLIASTSSDSLTSRNNKNNLALATKHVNKLAPKEFVNSVTDSSEVNISNTSNHIYNAPVIINNVYHQSDDAEQLATENTAEVPENSFYKRFYSIFRCNKAQQRYSAKWYLTISVLLLLIIGITVGLMIWQLNLKSTQAVDSKLRILSRTEWNARPPKEEMDDFLKILPAPLVIIHHTVTIPCDYQDQCAMLVQSIQNHHMDDYRWNDIGYNFLVGGDGLVYEGLGWNVAGAHLVGYNHWSIGIGLIGTFVDVEPTKVQLSATQQLMEYGVKNKYVSANYTLLGARQCQNSIDPGDALYKIMKTWDHWSPKCPKYQ